MARSRTRRVALGATTFIWAISERASLLPTVSIMWAAFRVRSRACSISILESAIHSMITPCSASGLPNPSRLLTPPHISSSALSATPIWRMQWWMRPGPTRPAATRQTGRPRPLGGAYLARAVVDAPRTQAPLRDGEAFALVPQDVPRRHPHVVEGDLRVAVRGLVVAEDREGPLYLHARGVEGNQDHGLLLVARRLRVRLAHQDGDLAPPVPRPGGPPLAAVHDVLVPTGGTLYPGLDVGRVRGGHVGLGHAEGGADLPLQERLEPLLLLLCGPVAGEDLHVARVGGVAVKDLGPYEAAAHDLAQRRVLQVREARPVLGVGQEEIPEAGGSCPLLELLHDWGGAPAVFGGL